MQFIAFKMSQGQLCYGIYGTLCQNLREFSVFVIWKLKVSLGTNRVEEWTLKFRRGWFNGFMVGKSVWT